MKKILSILLTIAMLLSMTVTAVAATGTSVHLKATKAQADAVDWVKIAFNDGTLSDAMERTGNQFDISDLGTYISDDISYFLIKLVDGGDPIPHYIPTDVSEGVEGGSSGGNSGTINYDLLRLRQYHTVTIDDDPDGTADGTGAGTYATTDAALYFTFTARTGFNIVDVTLDGDTLGVVSDYTMDGIDADHDFIIYTEREEYTITTNYWDGATLLDSDEVTKEFEDSFSTTFKSIPGYDVIDDVEVDSVSIGAVPGYSIPSVSANVVVDVYLIKNTYNVTIDSVPPGAVFEDGTDEIWDYGDDGTKYFSVSDPADTFISNVTLNGLDLGAIISYPIVDIDMDHAFVVYVNEIPEMSYVVTIDGDNGSTYDGAGVYLEGTVVIPTFGAMTGFRLINVERTIMSYLNGVDYGPPLGPVTEDLGPVTSDLIDGIHADYSYYVEVIQEHTIEVVVDPTGTATPETSWLVDDGDQIGDIVFAPVAGHAIVEIIRSSGEFGVDVIYPDTNDPILTSWTWNDGDEGYTQGGAFEDVTFTVRTVPLYDVDVVLVGDVDSATWNDSDEGTYLAGTTGVSFTFAAATGYEITDIVVNGSSVGTPDTYPISSVDMDYLIEVHTAKLTYNIEVSSVPEGKIAEDGYENTLDYMDDETVTFTPVDGWRITYVTLNNSYIGDVSSYDVVDITMDMEFVVHLAELPAPGIHIDKSANASEYEPGDTITYTFTVTNTGNIDYESVIFEDDLLGISRDLGPMPADGSPIVFQETFVTTAEGTVTNTASVSAYGYNYLIGEPTEGNGDESYLEPLAYDEDTVVVSVEDSPPPPSPKKYTLTLGSTAGGNFVIFEGSQKYTKNTLVDVSWVVDDGYEFVGYSSDSDDADINSADKIKMDEDKYLFAIFEEIVEEEEEEEILDIPVEEIPEAVIPDEPLPQTGGLPLAASSVVGMLVSGIGFGFRRKRR